jgi:hypothetical protein
MEPTEATAFAKKWMPDVFKSLVEKRNNVLESCRLFVISPGFATAAMEALTIKFGGSPLIVYNATDSSYVAEDPLPEHHGHLTVDDLAHRATLQAWSIQLRLNPSWKPIYRPLGRHVYDECEDARAAYIKWTKLLCLLFTKPRDFPTFWPWYESMLRRSRCDYSTSWFHSTYVLTPLLILLVCSLSVTTKQNISRRRWHPNVKHLCAHPWPGMGVWS